MSTDSSRPGAGDRVELVWTSDPHTRLKPGDRGAVCAVDPTGTVHVRWDCGSTLGLIPGVDQFTLLPPEPAGADGMQWGGRSFGELTPDEKRRVSKSAAGQLQRELNTPQVRAAVAAGLTCDDTNDSGRKRAPMTDGTATEDGALLTAAQTGQVMAGPYATQEIITALVGAGLGSYITAGPSNSRVVGFRINHAGQAAARFIRKRTADAAEQGPNRRWRTGGHWGRTIIAEGSGPPDAQGRREGDHLIGTMDTVALARLVVDAVNTHRGIG